MTDPEEVYELKIMFGFSDLQGNHYPRLRPEITWNDTQHLYNAMGPARFKDFCERNKDPKYYD